MKSIFDTILDQLIKLPRTISLNPDYKLISNSVSIKGKDINSKFILVDSSNEKYFLISEREAYVWTELKKDPDMNHLVINYYRKYKKFAVEFVDSIIYIWSRNGLILNTDGIFGEIKNKLDNTNTKKRSFKYLHTTFKKITDIEISMRLTTVIVNSISQIISAAYNTYIAFIIIILASFFNGILISNLINTGFTFSKDFSIIFLLAALFSIMLHELSHGFALNLFGHPVNKSGFKLYFFIPVFFIDTTIAWRNKKMDRLKIAAAGIIFNWVIGGFTYLTYILTYDLFPFFSQVILFFAVINTINAFINMIPFIEFDGYYILIDLINFPNLKNTALGVLNRFITTGKVRRDRLPLMVFAILHIIFMLLFIYLSLSLTINFIFKLS